MAQELNLETLKGNPGARRNGKRLGRGESSGLGKTSGRGGKGQTARNGGGVRPGFEGGQMPLYRRLPKVGFTSQKKVSGRNDFDVVKLSLLNKFDAGATVDHAALVEMGIIKGKAKKLRVKVLADNSEFNKKLVLKVDAISASARSKVEAAGGTVEVSVGAA